MGLPANYPQQYKQNLTDLIDKWGRYRRTKDKQALREFYHNCHSLSQEVSTFTLYALKQVLSALLANVKAGLTDDKDPKTLIEEIDWLMNQLIRGNNEAVDPFLRPGPANEYEAYLMRNVNTPTGKLERTRKPNVVIIDDQLSVAQALSKTLQDFSINAQYFTSIAAYQEAQSNINVDLILLDVVMPNIEMQEVFTFATKMVDNGIKVISCSAQFSFEARLMAVRAKVSDYVVKPINSYMLVEKIGRALGYQKHHRYHVVLIDDQQTITSFYRTMLERFGCDVTVYHKAEQMFADLDRLNPDLFLLDIMMPDVNGLEVAGLLRQENKFDFAPILFLTSDEQLSSRVAAIEAGADDVINKAAPLDNVASQIITRLQRAAKMRAFISKDPLTGVLNHGQIVDNANNAIRHAARRKANTALAMIDVDQFKAVNDKHGHIVGDRVLFALGQLLSNSVRENDSVGRYGGEEFIVIFEDCSIDDAYKKITQIKDVFTSLKFGNEKSSFSVTFSAGIVDLISFNNVMAAISGADKGLYHAKQGGRNKVVQYKLKDE